MHTCGTTTAINGALEPFCDALCCCCETHNGTLSGDARPPRRAYDWTSSARRHTLSHCVLTPYHHDRSPLTSNKITNMTMT